ncbi:MAG: glutamine amidotransferase-related protein, partial [Solirubrobacterales bacterium]
MRTLLIDNYDSFTYNLFQLLAEVNGVEPLVVRNDEASWEELERVNADNVVISPGPGRPDIASDFGVCAEATRRCEVPLLGVCLGLQGIGWLEGGGIERVEEPMHGRLSAVHHDGSPLFAGIPSPFRAVRYHSLGLARPLPPSLREIASAGGVPMAIEHKTRPQWGVQFHPESIATDFGRRLIENFRDLTPARSKFRGSFVRAIRTKEPRVAEPNPRRSSVVPLSAMSAQRNHGMGGTRLCVRRLDLLPDAEAAFVPLYGESENAFWLDSSRSGKRGRFSFMGDASGPLAEVVTCDVGSDASIFVDLERRIDQLRHSESPDLPFEFDCGFVGYLGYELKAECGHSQAHDSEHPDAAFILADRVIAFDHEAGCTYLLALHKASEEGKEVGADCGTEEWFASTAARLTALADTALDGESGGGTPTPPPQGKPNTTPPPPPPP